jgi:hypothetical protein
MRETDEANRTGGGGDHRVYVGGNAAGAVIAGNHNLVVDAQHGSTVTLLVERQRPQPVRRDRVALLPRGRRDPVGRRAATEALAQALSGEGPVQVVQVWGPPGVGKSTLLRYAARHLPPGPDGVVFLTGTHREVGDLAQEVFEACYEAAGYAPSGAELRRLMTGVRVTVYVDNAELTLDQLRELTDAAPDATFVLAAHDRSLLGDGEGTAIELTGLDREACLELFAREFGRPLAPAELPAATGLWEAAEGRPLLLLRAAGLATFDPSGTVALPRPGALADLLPLLLDRLDEPSADVLRLLATLGGDAELALAHIGALTGTPDPEALCERLTGLGLTLATESGYRCAPDAVPALRQRHPEPFSAERLCRYLADWAARPATTPAEVAGHGSALEAAARLAEQSGRPDLAVTLARAASPGLARSLRFGVWGRVLGRGWSAAQGADDARAMAYFTHEEGIRSLLTGRRVVSAVLLTEAVVLWKRLGDVHGAQAAQHAQSYAPALPHATAPHAVAPHAVAPHAVAPHAAAPHAAAPHAVAPHAATAHAAAPHAATAHTAAGHTAAAHTATTTPTAAAHMSALGHTPAATSAVPHVALHGTAAAHAGGTAAVTASGTAAGTGTGLGTAATAAGGVHAGTTMATAALAKLLVALVIVAAGIGIGVNEFASDDSPSSAGTADLAGVWSNAAGGQIEIVASGPGSYTAQAPGCDPSSIEYTGSDGHYTGPLPLWTDLPTSCSALGGWGTTTIDVAPGGATAQVRKEAPQDDTMECYTCGTETWTRASAP